MTESPPEKVYLFLFPPQVELMDGRIIVTNPPDTEKYYWAFDPTGLDRLTHQMAEDIGLPTPEFSTDLRGQVWTSATVIRSVTFTPPKGSIHTVKKPPSQWAIHL